MLLKQYTQVVLYPAMVKNSADQIFPSLKNYQNNEAEFKTLSVWQ